MISLTTLPRPKCCKKAGELNYMGEPRIYFWVSAEDENDRGWRMLGYISFCPWCGVKLPEMVKTGVPPKPWEPDLVCRIVDGGYYCDTCHERLDNCTCRLPGCLWSPA